MYAWRHPAWPNFTFDAAFVANDVTRVLGKAGELAGLRVALSERDQTTAFLNEISDEALNSYAIEGEKLDKFQLSDSIHASMMGKDAAEVSGPYRAVANVMLDARNGTAAMTVVRLNGWHGQMFKGQKFMRDIGRLRRGDMQVVSGRPGAYRTEFEAPPPEQVPPEMDSLMDWLIRTGPDGNEADHLPAPIRAAIAHFRFETIHPYEDGNGRIGRALADYVMAQDPVLARAPFSLSRAIMANRSEYYRQLKGAQTGDAEGKGIDISAFIKWFANMMEEGLDRARGEARYIVSRNAYFNRFIGRLNQRQERVLRRLFDEGPGRLAQGLSAGPYARISGASSATATRDLAGLVKIGALVPREKGGRSTGYLLTFDAGH